MEIINYKEIIADIDNILNTINNKIIYSFFYDYKNALYDGKSIEECFILFQIALYNLKYYYKYMCGKEMYSKYKYLFEGHLKLYPNKIEFENKIYIEEFIN